MSITFAAPQSDLSGEVSLTGEEGLLGLAFDPNYNRSGRFYVYYVGPGGSFGQGISHVALFAQQIDAHGALAYAGVADGCHRE
jgi:hypothetical protein